MPRLHGQIEGAPEPDERPPAQAAPAAARAPATPAEVIALQRHAGNAAVARALLAREDAPAAPAKAEEKPVEPTITYGANAVASAIPAEALQVLKDVMIASKTATCEVSSTARTVDDQVRVMYNNLEAEGVAAQKELYASAGDKVIDAYDAAKKAKKTEAEIKAAMKAKIEEVGASSVSRHMADYSKLVVFDVGPKSVADDAEFKKAARADARVSKFLTPEDKDPGFHFEIPIPVPAAAKPAATPAPPATAAPPAPATPPAAAK